MPNLFEKYAQDVKDASAAEHPNREKEIEGPTVKEILADKGKSDLFGEYLLNEGDKELGEKLLTGEPDRGDIDVLSKKRKGFLEILQRAENASELLDSDSLKEIIESSPDLKKLAEVGGSESIRAALKNNLPKMAITDRTRFEGLDKLIVARAKFIEEQGSLEETVKKTFEKYELNDDEIVKIVRGGDISEIVEKIKEDMSFVRSLLNSKGDIEKELRGLAKSHVLIFERQMAEAQSNMKRLGQSIESSLMDNDELRKAYAAEIRKDKSIKPEQGMSFADAKSEMEQRPDKGEVEQMRAQYRIKYRADLNAGRMTESDVSAKVARDYTSQKSKGKKGFWAMIWKQFFMASVENMIK